MGRCADAGKYAEWETRFRQYQASGLTVTEYCDWLGVSVATFYNWRRKLAEKSGSPKRRSAGGSGPLIDTTSFLPVRVVSRTEPASPLPPIEIQLPSGARILVPISQTATLSETLRDIVIAAAGLASARESSAC